MFSGPYHLLFYQPSSTCKLQTSGAKLKRSRLGLKLYYSSGGFLELFSLGIAELRKMLEKREISARDIHNSVFKRIDAVEGRIKAYVTVTREKALEMAEQSDKELVSRERKDTFRNPYCGERQHVHKRDTYDLCIKDIV